MWELDYKDSWELKNWCFQIVVLEKTLESPLENSRSNQSILKEINPEYELGRTDAEVLILWLPNSKSQHIGKASDVGTHWGQEKKGVTEDELVGWHHWLNAHEFELTPRYGERQGSLVYHSSWDYNELDMI